ncbi:MAG: family 16 glycosylhydrolase [Verrucomicrobiae bacterium]|nr:family 16 glycosylhydrolase [Verrucomicrobiae bacterium]NNJ44128.1 family 16 glycosylhydrolase [Akkermansiaceae bacterium]
MSANADTFGGGTIIQPATASGGTGAVADLQTDNDARYSVAKSASMSVGGFGSGSGTINSVYVFAQYSVESGYNGTNALKVNGVNTTIVPADRDYGRWGYTEITAGDFGVDTLAEIASLSVTFTNNDSGAGDAVLFDCIYIVVNPTSSIPIHPNWIEDFNGTGQANPMVWNYEEGYQRNNELQYYVSGSDNGWQEGGNFIIEGKKDTANDYSGYDYTSASIVTSNKYYWHYGRAQIRAKIPAKSGMWPAIWGTGEVGDWPHNGEVDILEYYNNKILANCAVGTTSHWGSKWDPYTPDRSMSSLEAVDSNWRTGWHIWTMQWDDQNVRLYVDNILMGTVPQTWLRNTNGASQWGPEYPFISNGMSCWLNLAIGGNAGGDPTATMNSGPQRYLIDYWKIWEGATSNVAPTDITMDSYAVQEGAPAGTVVGNLAAIDADPAEVHRYELVSGTGDTHNSEFSIPEFVSDNTMSGVLKTASVLSYDDGATRSIRVRVTDIEGAKYTKVININVIGQPQINVSPSSVSVPEGGTQTFSVKLRTPPASDITVNVSRQSGDSDLTVSSGASLVFTPSNGTDWQIVTLAAAEDGDNNNGTAIILCSDGSGTYTSETVDATEAENDNDAPVVDAGIDDAVFFSGGGPWSPAGISPDAWYDAADAATITEAAGVVSQWRDKSGNNYHLNQGTADKQPTYSATAWNGSLPAVTFDGSNDYLENVTKLTQGAVTLAAVFQQSNTDANDRAFGIRGSQATGPSSFSLAMDNTLRYDGGYSAGSITATTGKHLRVATRSTSSQLGYIDGSQNINASVSLDNIDGYINTGNVSETLANAFAGKVVEGLVIFGTISTTDREKIEGYFAHKWGLASNLPGGHPYFAEAPGGGNVTVILDGTVSDPNDDSLTTLWSVVSGPGSVSFDDASAVDTTASFSEYGSYVLRLTAGDGVDSTFAEVTITVSVANTYSAWAGGSFANPFTELGYIRNPDDDNLNNLQEFAFGTDPTSSDSLPLIYTANGDVNRPGKPILQNFAAQGESPAYRAVYSRRKDFDTAGLTYTVEFSADLEQWTASAVTPTVLTGSGSAGDQEAVSVPFLTTVPANGGAQNLPPKFFRVSLN